MAEKVKEKLNLYQKILKVMEGIEYLNKDDTVAYGNTRYKAMSEEKVTREVRAKFIEQGLVILPIEQDIDVRAIEKKDKAGDIVTAGYLTTVNTKYRIVDTDSGEFVVVASSGQGVDSQDKGSGKAMTYAFKYALLRSLAIPTGDDPDKISSEQITDEQDKELGIKDTKKDPDPVKLDTPEQTEKYLKEKFQGSKTVEYDKNTERVATLAEDKDVLAMKQRIIESGKTGEKVIDAIIRSYTPENKETCLRILESKI